MATTLLETALAGLLFLGYTGVQADQAPNADVIVVVEMVAPSDMPRDAVKAASEIVERVYRDFGVIVQWRDPSIALPDQAQTPWRRIVIKPSATKEFSNAFGQPRVMGSSPRNGNAPGWSAYIFYDAVLATARRHDLPVGSLMGYAMAHELGHLLLPVNGHGATGVMRANWEEAGLHQMRQQTLTMGEHEAALIRQYLDSTRQSR